MLRITVRVKKVLKYSIYIKIDIQLLRKWNVHLKKIKNFVPHCLEVLRYAKVWGRDIVRSLTLAYAKRLFSDSNPWPTSHQGTTLPLHQGSPSKGMVVWKAISQYGITAAAESLENVNTKNWCCVVQSVSPFSGGNSNRLISFFLSLTSIYIFFLFVT